MRTRTLEQLESEIRLLTDTEGDDHVTAEDIKLLVNQALPELHEMLAMADPNRFTTTTSVATTAGTTVYALPADFMSIRAVYLIEGTSRRRLSPFQVLERSEFTGAGGAYPDPGYMVTGNGTSTSIEFDPDPGTQTFTVYYLTGPGSYTDVTDTIDYTAGWEDWVVNTVAEKIAVREESDPAPFAMARTRAAQRIRHMARHRDAGQPPRVQDVYRGNSRRPRLPRP